MDLPIMDGWSKPFIIERTHSDKSRCKECKRVLTKNNYRIGKVISKRDSERGDVFKSWYHIDCIFIVFKRQRISARRIINPETDIENWEHFDGKESFYEKMVNLNKFINERTLHENKERHNKKLLRKQNNSIRQRKKRNEKTLSEKDLFILFSNVDDEFSLKSFGLVYKIINNLSICNKNKALTYWLERGKNGISFKGNKFLWVKFFLPKTAKHLFRTSERKICKYFYKNVYIDPKDVEYFRKISKKRHFCDDETNPKRSRLDCTIISSTKVGKNCDTSYTSNSDEENSEDYYEGDAHCDSYDYDETKNSNDNDEVEKVDNKNNDIETTNFSTADLSETLACLYFEKYPFNEVRPSISLEKVDKMLKNFSSKKTEKHCKILLDYMVKRCSREDLETFLRLILGEIKLRIGKKFIMDLYDKNLYEHWCKTSTLDFFETSRVSSTEDDNNTFQKKIHDDKRNETTDSEADNMYIFDNDKTDFTIIPSSSNTNIIIGLDKDNSSSAFSCENIHNENNSSKPTIMSRKRKILETYNNMLNK